MVVEDVVHLVFVRIAKWVSSKKEFDSLRVDGAPCLIGRPLFLVVFLR